MSVIYGNVSQLPCLVLFVCLFVCLFFYRNLAVTTKATRGYFRDRSDNRLSFKIWNLCCGAIVL